MSRFAYVCNLKQRIVSYVMCKHWSDDAVIVKFINCMPLQLSLTVGFYSILANHLLG